MSHEAILYKVIATDFLINSLRRCLKASVNPEFFHQGTPLGGVCLLIVANIVLNETEKIKKFEEQFSSNLLRIT